MKQAANRDRFSSGGHSAKETLGPVSRTHIIISSTGAADMNYRERIIDNLNRAAVRAQNVGQWDQADTYLSLASRYETLWAALDERHAVA